MSAAEHELAELRSANRQLRGQLAERDQETHDLRQQNDELRAKANALHARIERMSRRLYGWSSERHHPGQQAIDLGQLAMVIDPAATIPAAPASSDDAPSPAAPTVSPVPSRRFRQPRTPGSHPGRRRLPDHAEVIETDIAVPASERLDEHGQPLPFLGWWTSDKWDYRQGSYLIRRFRRAIYGQPFCDAQSRIVAAMPTFLILRGLTAYEKMTDAALIHTVIEKFADHLPLYRQVLRAGRSGIHLSRSKLISHVAAVAKAMGPIVDAIASTVRCAPFIHLDDTPVRVLDPGRGHTATGRIWVYRTTDAAVFRFTPTR